MKKIIVLLALLSTPTLAALRVAPANSVFNSGPLVTITTDTVSLALRGDEWATAQFTVSSAGTATATAQVSIDGGTNWIASAYCKRLSTANANPTVQAISATTLTTADVWECPLPGNSTHFRLLCGGTGTATNVQINSGVPYVPGVPVVATLYDFTEANIGDGILSNTTIQDVSGWNSVSVYGVSPTGQTVAVQPFDDAGTGIQTQINFTAASFGLLTMNRFANTAAVTAVTAAARVSSPFLGYRRIGWYLSSGGTGTKGRIRVEASR